jgi:hypothetical protein
MFFEIITQALVEMAVVTRCAHKNQLPELQVFIA